MSQNPHLGDTFNLLQWQIPVSPTPSYSIPFIGGAQSEPNCYFHNAIQLKGSSASRSVNLQTNRTKTWQFKFTRNQGFTQDPNSEEMRRQWKAADNTRTMRQTARSRPNTRQRAKQSHLARHNTNTCSSETRCSWLYTNSAFNSLTKRNERFRYIQQNHP